MSLHVARGQTRSPSAAIMLLVAVLTGGTAAAQPPGHTINPTVLAPSARQALPHGGVTVDSPEPGHPPHPAHGAAGGNGNGRLTAPAHRRHHPRHHHVKPFVEEWR